MKAIRFKNEIMVIAAVLFAVSALGYKHMQRTSAYEQKHQLLQEIETFQKVASLKQQWNAGDTHKKLDAVHTMFANSVLFWKKQGRKLSASFGGLSAKQLGTLMTKLFNIPVQIDRIHIEKKGDTYQMEFSCKW